MNVSTGDRILVLSLTPYCLQISEEKIGPVYLNSKPGTITVFISKFNEVSTVCRLGRVSLG